MRWIVKVCIRWFASAGFGASSSLSSWTMQRREPEGIIISCDFCGTDWDQIKPMIEGHRGSIICLACLIQALQQMQAGAEGYECRLCLRTGLPASLQCWSNPDHPSAVVCRDCLEQAAKAFDKDPEVDWKWNRTG